MKKTKVHLIEGVPSDKQLESLADDLYEESESESEISQKSEKHSTVADSRKKDRAKNHKKKIKKAKRVYRKD